MNYFELHCMQIQTKKTIITSNFNFNDIKILDNNDKVIISRINKKEPIEYLGCKMPLVDSKTITIKWLNDFEQLVESIYLM